MEPRPEPWLLLVGIPAVATAAALCGVFTWRSHRRAFPSRAGLLVSINATALVFCGLLGVGTRLLIIWNDSGWGTGMSVALVRTASRASMIAILVSLVPFTLQLLVLLWIAV